METSAADERWAVERLIRRERAIVLAGVAIIALLAWLYLLRMSGAMEAMAADAEMHAAMGMADVRAWGLADWLGLFAMWAVMMVAMMLPSAAPVILLVLGAYRRRGNRRAWVSAVAFVAGYLIAWSAFSAAAAAAQVGLHRAALLDAAMVTRSVVLAGAMLLAAGVYQLLPIKTACLTHCQSPLGFLTAHWRDGATGGLRMGLRHGAYCIGCCWALMLLLFASGVMNLLWVAAIAAFVLLEKLVPPRFQIRRAAGVLLIAGGIAALANGLTS
jgi:predicted metal-binding membrane protein